MVRNTDKSELEKTLISLVGAGLITGAGAFLYARWKVAKPQQFLVKTGAFTNDKMVIGRSLIQFPFQLIPKINLF